MRHSDFAHLKILLVEDQAFIRATVVRLLRGFGCGTVSEASDGESAIALLDERPDLVICDIGMRPMDGLAFLGRLRQHAHAANAAVIILTAKGDSETVRQAIALGADAYLLKPVIAGALREKIEAVLRRGRANGATPPS